MVKTDKAQKPAANENDAIAYYISKRDEFTMFGSTGHIPGALAKRNYVDQYLKGDSLKKVGVDYDLFVQGQLAYRRKNDNKDY